jgi:hypothetical protein
VAVADLGVSSLLEIENVQGFRWTADDFRGRWAALGETALPKESRDSAERGNIGTGGQELQKFATSSGGTYGLAHGSSLFAWY